MNLARRGPSGGQVRRAGTLVTIAATCLLATGVVAGCQHDSSVPPPIPSSPSAVPSATPTRTPSPTPRPSATPTRRTDPLTGARTVSTNPVVAVKIDNTANGRPQVGLSAADQVWVEQVEGGLTRLMAVYHTRFPGRAGPVRSARSTDVELLPVYGRPLLLYSGANHNVQGKLDRSTVPHRTQGSAGFHRVGGRSAPYNLMVDVRTAVGHDKVPAARDIGITFAAKDARWSAAPAKAAVTVRIGSGTEAFRWHDGHYQVTTNGHAVTDGGSRVTTDNVVVLKVKDVPDGNKDVAGAASVKSRTVGKGRVTILRDGRVLRGTWKRSKPSGPLHLTDAKGRSLPLKPGRTWFLLQG